MRKNGWISVAGHGDGPSQVVSVTPQGRKLMAAVHTQWKKAQKRAAELLGEEGVVAIQKLHDTVRPRKTKN